MKQTKSSNRKSPVKPASYKYNSLKTKLDIAKDWLPRYTGTQIDEFGDYMLLTNFHNYVTSFADQFGCDIKGTGKPMQTATNSNGLTIINFGIGSANAATIMDLLVARNPKGVLFLGKCGGLKRSTEIGHFILPIAAIRGEVGQVAHGASAKGKFPLFLHSNCTNLFLKNLLQETLNTGPVWFILLTEEYGSGIPHLRTT